MKIRRIKQIIIFILFGLVCSNLYFTYGIWENRPDLKNIQFPENQTINLNPAPSTNTTITESADDDFEYEVIGYRASTGERSSVVLKKNNDEYVVQEGELLDNRYTLTNVEKDKVTFTFSGQIYELENRVGKR